MRTAGGVRSRAMLIQMIVRSHLPGVKLTDEVAKNLARDYLTEIGWFGDESVEADFVF
jgi:hypothetical protein